MHIHFPGCLPADLEKIYESKRSAGLPATPTSSCCAQGVLTVPLKSSMVSACMAVALGQSQTVMECHYNIQPFLMTPEWMALVATWLKGHGEGICAVWNPPKMAKNMKGSVSWAFLQLDRVVVSNVFAQSSLLVSYQMTCHEHFLSCLYSIHWSVETAHNDNVRTGFSNVPVSRAENILYFISTTARHVIHSPVRVEHGLTYAANLSVPKISFRSGWCWPSGTLLQQYWSWVLTFSRWVCWRSGLEDAEEAPLQNKQLWKSTLISHWRWCFFFPISNGWWSTIHPSPSPEVVTVVSTSQTCERHCPPQFTAQLVLLRWCVGEWVKWWNSATARLLLLWWWRWPCHVQVCRWI